jgi:hypothetical protein
MTPLQCDGSDRQSIRRARTNLPPESLRSRAHAPRRLQHCPFTAVTGVRTERGRRDAARDLLAPIYNWFTEGFDAHHLNGP